MNFAMLGKSALFFTLAGLCELGGAYLIWLWLKDGRSAWLGLLGAAVLVAYGFMHTQQPSNYGRIQAAYSGFFYSTCIAMGMAGREGYS